MEVTIAAGEPGPSGVAETEYKVGESGKWTTYKTPFTVEEAGEHDLYARTVDKAGNVGAESQSTVKIDRTKPLAPKISLSEDGWTNEAVEVAIAAGEPGPSGVSETEYKVGATGEWVTYKTPFKIEEAGEHDIYARTVDQAGNVGFESQSTVKIDRTKPTAPKITLSKSGWTNEAVEVAIAAGEPGPSGVAETQYKVGESGKWTTYKTPFTVEEAGEHDLYARTVDKAGNVGAESQSTVKIDRTKPLAPKISLSEDGWINEAVEVAIAAGEPGPSGVAETQYKVGSTGEWVTYKTPFKIEEAGEHDIYARTVDKAGNVGAESQSTVKIDRTKPLAPKISLSEDGWINEAVEVTIAAGEPGPSGVAETQYKVGESGKWTTYQTPFTVEEAGEHDIYARTVNQAGNVGAESQSAVKIDRTKPSAPKITLSKSGWTNEAVEVTIAAGEPGPSGVSETEYKVGESGKWTTYQTPFTVEEAGEHDLYARTVDQAGNVGAESQSTVKIDRTKPLAPKISLSEDGWTNEAVEVAIAAGEPGPSGVAETEYKVGESGKWTTYQTPFTVEEAGEHDIYARTVNQAGNVGAESQSAVKIDRTKPLAPKISLSEDGWINEAVEVAIAAGEPGPSGVAETEYKVGESGKWTTYQSPFTVEEAGEHDIYARTVDQAGNIGSESQSTVKIDRTKPLAPKISLSEDGWTNEPVEVMIAAGEPGPSGVAETQYKVGKSGKWTTYQTPFTVEEAGEHDIYARTVNQAGNVGAESQSIVQINRTAPILLLNGNEKIVMETGLTYKEQGANAFHTHFGNLTDRVQIIGNDFDTTTPGTHKITYSITDPAGNEAKLHRTVQVVGVSGLTATEDVPNELKVGDTYQLNVVPVYEKNKSKPTYRHKATFKSSNSELASIRNDGLIQFHKYGTVVIYATYGDIEESWLFEIDDDYLYLNEQRILKSGKTYTLKGTNVQLSTPENLLAGTRMFIQHADIRNTNYKGLNQAGDRYSFTVDSPNPFHLTDPYTLTMKYDQKLSSAQVAIYYLDEQQRKWVHVGGEVDPKKHVITARVPHFSTYAVFSDDQSPDIIIFEAEPGEKAVKLNFKAEDASGVSYYRLLKNGKEIATLQGTDEVYTDHDVKPDTVYTYQLISGDIYGNESSQTIQARTKSASTPGVKTPPKTEQPELGNKHQNTKQSAAFNKETEKRVVDEAGNDQGIAQPAPNKPLPNTATNMLWYLLMGMIIFSLGISILFWLWLKRRR
ncbi:LPXTG-motif cell wall-anchored protein [Bacillus thermophilus]|uniref:LPXTG-motif cell wall-anchored protein n=1 Tax=Siminovitchia thermophila TaxID=1245522 RepID=A0ABS2RD43_9BACI|nr:immunoglobulin-like domain-containing protein [Siminovitchia thermophila]MBM7717576.1 LPXTG-motif cell wall-anchored protein [Siminovitchia thermophila]